MQRALTAFISWGHVVGINFALDWFESVGVPLENIYQFSLMTFYAYALHGNKLAIFQALRGRKGGKEALVKEVHFLLSNTFFCAKLFIEKSGSTAIEV